MVGAMPTFVDKHIQCRTANLFNIPSWFLPICLRTPSSTEYVIPRIIPARPFVTSSHTVLAYPVVGTLPGTSVRNWYAYG